MCVCVCVCVCICVCAYVCMCVCVCVCMFSSTLSSLTVTAPYIKFYIAFEISEHTMIVMYTLQHLQ